MITQQYFENFCKKLFNDDCEIKTEVGCSLELFVKCFYHDRLVAKLHVRKNMSTEATVYDREMNTTYTSYRWRFKYLLTNRTYTDRKKDKVIKFITTFVHSEFYRHADDIWDIVNKITDDVFACDVRDIAEKLMDKADLAQYGEVQWRTKANEDNAEISDEEFEKFSTDLADALKSESED